MTSQQQDRARCGAPQLDMQMDTQCNRNSVHYGKAKITHGEVVFIFQDLVGNETKV